MNPYHQLNQRASLSSDNPNNQGGHRHHQLQINSLTNSTPEMPELLNPNIPSTQDPKPNPSEEDVRFFKLAKEAIVATAKATSKTDNKQILDPTLNDLFMRLQYVSSPHGNPIKNGENIQVNDKGQLMIQDFYQNFPNLDNNIFQDPTRNAPQNDTTSYWRQSRESLNAIGMRNPLIGANPFNENPGIHNSMVDFEDNGSESPEDRKYQCHKCTMNFKRSSDLKRHEKQHLSIPPNICEDCGKGFARKDALKRHIGTATCKRNAQKKLYVDNLELLRG